MSDGRAPGCHPEGCATNLLEDGDDPVGVVPAESAIDHVHLAVVNICVDSQLIEDERKYFGQCTGNLTRIESDVRVSLAPKPLNSNPPWVRESPRSMIASCT